MNAYFKNIFSGGWSLFVGMGITLRYFFKPVVTSSYPREVLPITPRYRGHIDLVYDPETGTDRCIVCGSCQKACPSGCIELAGEKLDGAKKKTLTQPSPAKAGEGFPAAHQLGPTAGQAHSGGSGRAQNRREDAHP